MLENNNYYVQPIVNIPRPITIKYNVYDTYTLYYNMPNKVYIPQQFNNILDCFIPNICIDDELAYHVSDILKSKLIYMLNSLTTKQLIMMREFCRENESYKDIIEKEINNFKSIITDKVKYYFDKNRNIMIVSEKISLLSTKNAIICFNSDKDVYFVFNKLDIHQIYLKSTKYHNIEFMYSVNQNKFRGTLKTDNINETMNIMLDDNYRMSINFNYNEKNSREDIKLVSNMIKMPDSSYYQVYKENNINGIRTFDKTTKNKQHIIQCMKTGEDGLRFRGTYSELKQDDKIIDKVIKKDDIILYQKKNEQVIVDSINSIKERETDFIGWKAVKNNAGNASAQKQPGLARFAARRL